MDYPPGLDCAPGTEISDTITNKLFIGGLDYATTEFTVQQYFSCWGPVQASIKWFPDGRSRGFGFCVFANLADLENCMAIVEHRIDGRKVELRRADTGKGGVAQPAGVQQQLKEYDPEAPELRQLLIKHLDPGKSEQEVREYFLKYGKIDSVTMGNGEAVINFNLGMSVDLAQRERPHQLQGRDITTHRATPAQLVGTLEAEVSTKRAFIGPPEVRQPGHSGLSDDITDQDLENYFRMFGIVVNIEQKYWEDSGKKRGYGYVEFTEEDAVEKIVLVRTHVIHGREIEAKKCLTREQLQEARGRQAAPVGGGGGEAEGGLRSHAASKLIGPVMPGTVATRPSPSAPAVAAGVKRGLGLSSSFSGSSTRIYIGTPDDEKGQYGSHGLSDYVSDEALKTYFSQYGGVVKVDQLVWRDTGRKRGYGYIHMETPEGAEAAVVGNGGIHHVSGARLQVKRDGDQSGGGRSAPKTMRIEQQDANSLVLRRIMVKNLSNSTTQERLKEYFEQFGEVADIHLPNHADNPNKRKGFAFLTFTDAEYVDEVQRRRPHILDGRDLESTRATPKEQVGNPELEARCKRLYIGGCSDDKAGRWGHSGLTDSISDNELREYFGQFGRVLSVKQNTWKDTGKKCGYGYIEFDDEDPVDKIVLIRIHHVGDCKLEAKKGLTREQLEATRASRGNTGIGANTSATGGADWYGYGGGRDKQMTAAEQYAQQYAASLGFGSAGISYPSLRPAYQNPNLPPPPLPAGPPPPRYSSSAGNSRPGGFGNRGGTEGGFGNRGGFNSAMSRNNSQNSGSGHGTGANSGW